MTLTNNATDTSDPAKLKALLDDLQSELIEKDKLLAANVSSIKNLNAQINCLHESLRLERARKYASSSEKSPGQQELFDEVDQIDLALDEESNSADELAPATDPAAKKPKRHRKPLNPDLPRVKTVIDLDASERQCPCGCEMTEIGETVSEQLDIIPAKVQVLQTVRKKYACKQCEENIKIAPAPSVLLPKAIASANTMAYVIIAKYLDGLPLYRLSCILQRYGIELSRQTLSESVLSVAHQLEPLIERLVQHLLSGSLIHIDETRVQVLKEPGKSAQSNSYMWVRRGGPPDRTVIHFHYDPSRAASVPEALLKDFNGAVMSDGYEPYRTVTARHGLDHLCCMAHARRKFVDAKKAQPKGKSGRADVAIAFIRKLYAIETRCEELSTEIRYSARQESSKPVLNEFKSWLDDAQQKIAPKNKLGVAINYTLKYWAELSRYSDNGDWPIDNNPAENAIRPFVIGRKAWLFSNSQRGATASANLYSLIETAKANNREPYQYLIWMLNKLPTTSSESLDELMPWNMPQETQQFD